VDWEPTAAEIDAYARCARDAAREWPVAAASTYIRAGLQGAYAQLRARLPEQFTGELVTTLTPPLVEYDTVTTMGELNGRAGQGWRLVSTHVDDGRMCVVYIIERPRPPDGDPQ
jgi:hypothetical protein